MDDRIVRKALQVVARRSRHPGVVALGTYLPAVVETANQNGERAATMRQVDLELRVPVKHAAEDQVAGGDRGIKRIAEQVREVVGLGAMAAKSRQRMQKDRQAERLDAREDRLKQGIVEVAPFDVSAQVNTAHAWQFARTIEFVNGVIGVKHRQGQEGNNPRWIGEMRGTRAVVPRLGESEGNFRIAPIIHWRRK